MEGSEFLVPLETHCVYYDPDFLPPHEADEYYQDLLANIKWEKTSKINRWVSLHHEMKDTDALYRYKDAPGCAINGFNETLRKIQNAAQEWYYRESGMEVEFNVCLLNYYEDGQQRIGWHSDREEIGRTTPIASVSLGATRQFMIRSKENGVHDRATIDLQNGSLVLMENVCQMQYLHSVPKQNEVADGRINLTFRCKSSSHGGTDGTTLGEFEHERRDDWLKNITDGVEPNPRPWSINAEQRPHDSPLNSPFHYDVFGDNVSIGALDTDYSVIRYLVKTNLGAERYCGAEMQEVIGKAGLKTEWNIVAAPLGMDGFVACCAPSSLGEVSPSVLARTTSSLLALKSAHHILSYHTHFRLEDCIGEEKTEARDVGAEALYSYLKKQLDEGKVTIASLHELQEGGSFRVTCERIGGPHGFQAPEVEFEMGGAMAEHYSSIRPKMKDYDICVQVNVVGDLVIVGTQLNVHDLSKERHFLKFRNAVTIKTNLAYAMVRLAAIEPGNRIADPFCGSGTLLLEALETYNGMLSCIGMDVSKRSAEGARANAIAENYGCDVCKFVCSDARGLRRHLEDESVDAIITNLPWGVMVGHKNVSDLKTLYEIFLRNAWYTLKPGGRIVMLVLRGLQVTRIVRKLSGRYRLLTVNVVRTTNNLPCLIVIEKLAVDEIRDCVKSQLAHLERFVNVSPEMYQAIHTEAIDDDT